MSKIIALFRGTRKKSDKAKKQMPPLLGEFFGVLLLAFSVVLITALFSYDEIDNIIKIGDEIKFKNLLGPFGAILAEWFFAGLGVWAIFLPLTTFYLALILLQVIKNIFSKIQIAGFTLVLAAIATILAHIGGPINSSEFLLSGLLGHSFKNMLVYYFHDGGLWIISATLILSGMLLLCGRPFMKGAMSALLLPVFRLFSWLKSKLPTKPKPAKIITELKIQEPVPEFVPEQVVFGDIQIIEQDRKVGLSALKKVDHESRREFSFSLPPLNLLDYDEVPSGPIDQARLKNEAEKLRQAFLQFGIEGKIREIRPGPVVTNYEFVPAAGIKLSRIAALSDDIAMAMAAVQVRIVTPIPGKGAVGIEVPNEKRETVYLKEIVASDTYRAQKHKLCMAIGKDVEGKPYFMNLADMPHVLVAGTTGSGKSVSVNAMICSILYRATPSDVKFIMIDPKMLELSIYSGIPHLLLPPIIDSKKAANALRWAVKEMDTRYELMKEAAVRDITTYNEKIAQNSEGNFKEVQGRKHEHMPFIVIVVDEYADLLAVAGKEVEGYIMRIAQKARASGIHIMLATQRPSVDVITGVIKANFPVRMGFRLASNHDSKTIINKTGAEKLLGKGDVLIMPPGTIDLYRVHGAFISEKELSRVVKFLSDQRPPDYREDIAEFSENIIIGDDKDLEKSAIDEKYNEAIDIVRQHKKCSTSFMQRHLSVGYNRAARIVEQMEKTGVVGPVLNAKGEREIFIDE